MFVAAEAVYENGALSALNVPLERNGVPALVRTHGAPPAFNVSLDAIVRIFVIVVVAVDTFVLDALVPPPKVRLANCQGLVPPKFPVPFNWNMPPVIAIVPLPVTPPEETIISPVPESVPAVIVSAFAVVVAVPVAFVSTHPPPNH